MQSSYTRLPSLFFEAASAETVSNPNLLFFNHALASDLGLDISKMSDADLAQIFSGNRTLPGSKPIALAYAGHQFGHFSPRLGDGRALLIGEMNGYDLQLKGSGRTPFSRRGDGKSALGPVIRETIMSESMHALHIPTTRALAAVSTGELVQRETMMAGGVFTRVAKSHLRVGTFEWVKSQKNEVALRELADYAIERLAPELRGDPEKYLAFFRKSSRQYLSLISKWMGVGFIHGVMNTDNSSLSGETLDFGPCAFMDDFHFDRHFSSIDENGRYRYENQPLIGFWNLSSLANCFITLVHSDFERGKELLQNEFEELKAYYETEARLVMGRKLGLKAIEERDQELIDRWLQYLNLHHLDFTNAHQELIATLESERVPSPVLIQDETFHTFQRDWKTRLKAQNDADSISIMKANNPVYIPRNHLVEKAIEGAYAGDLSFAKELMEVLKNPYQKQIGREAFTFAPDSNQDQYKTFCGT